MLLLLLGTAVSTPALAQDDETDLLGDDEDDFMAMMEDAERFNGLLDEAIQELPSETFSR